jgi:hypothetical protein
MSEKPQPRNATPSLLALLLAEENKRLAAKPPEKRVQARMRSLSRVLVACGDLIVGLFDQLTGPAERELAEMEQGRSPVTLRVMLLADLQQAYLALETVAEDLDVSSRIGAREAERLHGVRRREETLRLVRSALSTGADRELG